MLNQNEQYEPNSGYPTVTKVLEIELIHKTWKLSLFEIFCQKWFHYKSISKFLTKTSNLLYLDDLKFSKVSLEFSVEMVVIFTTVFENIFKWKVKSWKSKNRQKILNKIYAKKRYQFFTWRYLTLRLFYNWLWTFCKKDFHMHSFFVWQEVSS